MSEIEKAGLKYEVGDGISTFGSGVVAEGELRDENRGKTEKQLEASLNREQKKQLSGFYKVLMGRLNTIEQKST